tara:strand:- start:204 stop:476 length:273 start_codon:yes stop_codon:yes gene_type:complete
MTLPILYLSSSNPINDIKINRKIKMLSISRYKDNNSIDIKIPNPPDVGFGIECIPLIEGSATDQGYLIKKYVNIALKRNEIRYNIIIDYL